MKSKDDWIKVQKRRRNARRREREIVAESVMTKGFLTTWNPFDLLSTADIESEGKHLQLTTSV